jgi:hypothetical protein
MAVLLKNFDPSLMFVWLRDTMWNGNDCKRGDVVVKSDMTVRKLMQLYLGRKLGYSFQLTDNVGSLETSDEGAKMGLFDSLKNAAKELLKEKGDELIEKAKEKAEEKAIDLVEKAAVKVKDKLTKK